MLKIIIFNFIIPFQLIASLEAQQGTHFVFSQLKFSGNWDPHPGSFQQIYHYLDNTTSLRIIPARRVITLDDEKLFYSPFLLIAGTGRYPVFSDGEILNLRRYIEGGGTILIDTQGDSEFLASTDRTIKRIFGDKKYIKIPNDHAIFRSFYLVDYVSGRILNKPYLEGITSGGRIAVIKSHNDLMGIWPRDRVGNWKNELIPSRTNQRKEAIKLTLNILMYSVCGTYKSDPVHQPFIKRKLGR